MLWKLAVRNLARHRTRTVLGGLAFLGGAAVMELSFGLADGTYADMINVATAAFTGQGQVHRTGYLDDPSLYAIIDSPDAVRRAVLATPGVTAASVRLLSHALVSVGEHTAGALVVGLDPKQENGVTAFSGKLCSGRMFRSPSRREILVGTEMAALLHAKIGDRLVLVTQAADGSLANDLFTLTGLVRTGMDDLDRTLLFMNLSDAQRFFVLPHAAHEIAFRTTDPIRIDRVVRRIRRRVGTVRKGLEVFSWKTILPELYTSIELDRASGYITLGIIALICALGVVNTILMSVLERTREFGVLRALGTRPGQVGRLVMFETALLAVTATALGMGAGAAAIWFMRNGVPLGARVEFGGVILDSMRARFSFRALCLTPILMLGTGILAGVLPAIRAARLVPVVALRDD